MTTTTPSKALKTTSSQSTTVQLKKHVLNARAKRTHGHVTLVTVNGQIFV